MVGDLWKCRDNFPYKLEFQWPLADNGILTEYRCQIPSNRIEIRHTAFVEGIRNEHNPPTNQPTNTSQTLDLTL